MSVKLNNQEIGMDTYQMCHKTLGFSRGEPSREQTDS
jgi:hypothetical protein